VLSDHSFRFLAVLVPLLLLTAAPTQAQDLPDHGAFTGLLEEIVETPLVNYQVLMQQRDRLDRFVDTLGRTSMSQLESASTHDQLAFWLNAYNACMLQLVADHYPIERGGVGFSQRQSAHPQGESGAGLVLRGFRR